MTDKLPQQRPQPMDRVRVGVTGLAAVVLILALFFSLASVVGRNVTEEAANVPPPIANRQAAKDDEPLAQLGVAPATPGNQSAGAPGARR